MRLARPTASVTETALEARVSPMRLARKLILALVLGITLVMAANAVLQVRRETALFDDDARQDQQAVGRVLQSAVEMIWPTQGETAARQLIAEASRDNPTLAMRWVSLAPNSLPGDLPLVAPDRLTPLAAGQPIVLRARGSHGDERRVTYMPFPGIDPPHAALEISESLRTEQRFTRATELQVLATTLAMVMLCAALATGLGFWFVGRPIQALRDKARRVGAGDLSEPLAIRQHDEIGELAGELNAMCDRLEAANRQLAIVTDARIAALEQLRHADRLKTVGQLASGMAHELGTPLNVIAGRAKLISEHVVEGDAATDSARIIAEQAARITTIIRQLLDFSRRRGASLGPRDLRSIATRTADLLAAFARKRGASIAVEGPHHPLTVQADAAQMQQVLTNLVVNGLHAVPDGGRVTIRLDRRRATPPPDVGGLPREYATIAVEDDGTGIPAEHLPRVFEPFFTTKDVGEGTGLGLSVAFGIVRDHGGWIDVESEPGRGSRFTVFLQPAPAEGAA